MRLTRQIVIQLLIFSVLAVVALGIMVFSYMGLPAILGVGVYRVTLELPEAGGLYPRGNVTYRGTHVGIVKSLNITDTGVAADLRSIPTSRSPPTSKPRCTASPRSVSCTCS